MLQIVKQPYQKTYTFPLFSYASLLRYGLLLLAIVGSFFIVYATPNFYRETQTQLINHANIQYSWNYQVYITANKSLYHYQNMYDVDKFNKFIDFQVSDDNQRKVMKIKIKYPKQSTHISNVTIVLPFSYTINSVSNFGLAYASVTGPNLAQVSFVGYLKVQKGINTNTTPVENSAYKNNDYNLQTTLQNLHQYSTYLHYHYNVLPFNIPSAHLDVTLILNYGAPVIQQITPSILSQAVWSWTQYFPIFLFFYYITSQLILFMFKQGILSRKVTHSAEYLKLWLEKSKTKTQ